MTTTAYLILISGLCALAGFMVYTRLSLRPKRRVAIDAGADSVPLDEPVSSVLEEAIQEEESVSVSVNEDTIEAKPLVSQESAPGDEYYDDLQRAAEGLAELMRSSAEERVPEILSEKTSAKEQSLQEHHDPPVREESDEQEITRIRAEICGDEEEIADEVEASMPELSAGEWLEVAETTPEAIVQESEETCVEEEMNPAPVRTIVARSPREIVAEALGEDVHDRIEAIDSGLDQLEQLVLSIESSLASLSEHGEEEALPAAVEAA